MESNTKLLDQMRDVLRLKHLSLRTEEAYISWVKRFILFICRVQEYAEYTATGGSNVPYIRELCQLIR